MIIDIFSMEESEEAVALESEISNLFLDLAETETELITLESEFKNYETASQVVLETYTNELERKFAFENIQEEESNIFSKIVAALKKFVGKLKDLWSKLILWIKTQLIELDDKWYRKYKEKAVIGIGKATDADKVTIKFYELKNAAQEVVSDMKIIQTELDSFYKSAKELVEKFMNPVRDKTFFQKLRERFGEVSIQQQMIQQIKEQWDVVKKACHINDMGGTMTGFNIRETILHKYYGGKGQSSKAEVPVLSFAPNIETINNILAKESVDIIQKTCEAIKTGSIELELLLNKLDNYVKKKYDATVDKDLEKDINDGKLGAISIIRGTLSICNTIGSTYWKIYMGIRTDIKHCVNVYVKIAKK
jgi:hypothetical protein